MMSGFERKFGKYAIKNLTLMLIFCYAIGYLLELLAPAVLNYMTIDPYMIIHKYQIWRLITWVVVPPSSFSFWTLIMLYFYYSLGTSLEMNWGTYRYNVYLLSGLLFTIVGAFALYFVTVAAFPVAGPVASAISAQYSSMFSTYYINMSIFLAFAATFPDYSVLILFVLPIKVKYLGIIYGAMLVYEFVAYIRYGNVALCVVIFVSLLNFIIFFITQRKSVGTRKIVSGQNKSSGRKMNYGFHNENIKQEGSNAFGYKRTSGSVTRHKCAICGKTEETDPDLQFRFCSKCNGNYEYCENHLFTHRHT